MVDYFSRYDEFVWDLETIGEHRGTPAHNQVTWLGLATHGMAVAIPMGHDRGKIIGHKKEPRILTNGRTQNKTVAVWSKAPEQLRPSQVFEALEPLFFSDRLKIAHNAPFDLASLAKYYDGRVPDKPWFDTFINSVLLNENRLNGLKQRVNDTWKVNYDKENVGKCVEEFPFQTVARYVYMDAKYTWLLYQEEKDLCAKEGLEGLLALELDVVDTVVEMALNGAPINPTILEEFGVVLDERLVDLEGEIYRGVGQKFNLNSSQQKAKIFYGSKKEGGLGLKPTALTDGGKKKRKEGKEILVTDWSTDSDALEPHKDHPVIANVLKYQKDMKLKSTYVTGILGDPDDPKKPCRVIDGRVHGSFKQLGAKTGRWSSAEPNLQNIPSRGDDGKIIRSAYEALPGWKEVVADYGQIELVMLAHFIGFGALYEGFKNGIDAHTMTASLVFGVPFEEFAREDKTPEEEKSHKEMRGVAKSLNFAIVYGAGPAKVADMADISLAEAKRHMETHREMFPEIYRYKAWVINQAKQERDLHVRTILGRKRRLKDLRIGNDELRASAERKCFNAKIQGSGADIIKLAMVRLLPLLPEHAELILTVHDELVVHAREDVVPLVVDAMKEAMLGEDIQRLVKVPLTSDISVVDNWSLAK
ncbi:DNA polymerase [Nonomuraea jabiensis]|uniref:DNA polymerase n=1 Tax=Nonomuraea jabiensis TaxID=882448 RepID=UPI003442758F